MTRETPPLHYGFATREDGAACNAINNDVYKRNRTLAQWEWEFTPPHLPFEEIPYAVARDGGDIVGTQGYIMVPMISQQGTFWTAKGEDAVVLFRYWARNVLPDLWATLAAFCERNKVTMAWGFNSRRGSFSRVGLQYFEEPLGGGLFRPLNHRAMDTVLKDTTKMKKLFERPGGGLVKTMASIGTAAASDTRMLISRAASLSGNPVRNLVIDELRAPPGEEFEALAQRFIRQYGGITVHRSPQYLQWRLLGNPFLRSTIITARRHGELCGYVAFAVAPEGQAHIADQFICAPGGDAGQNRAIAEELLFAVVRCARGAGASVIRAQCFNGHPADRIFLEAMQRVGFFKRTGSVGACYRLFPDAAAPPVPVTTFDDWYVTGVYHEGREG